MLPFIYYLLKVTLISGLLYGYYSVALRNKKFHRYNRFYLLGTVLLSLLIPLIKINFLNFSIQKPGIIKFFSTINNTNVYVKTSAVKHYSLSDYTQLALYAFLVVTSAALIFLIFQLIKIFSIIKANPSKVWNDVCFVFTKNKETPFSFFKYIFWNENINMDSNKGRQILQHELTHVKQHHSADKLFLNVILAAFWLNPFFWIIRNELNMVHEFLADESAISNGDTSTFAVMLLTAAYPQQSFTLSNSFFHSPIKRRLFMITESKTISYSYFRRLMILPLLAFVSVLSAFTIEGKRDKNSGKSAYEDVNKKELLKDNPSAINNSDTTEAKFPGGNMAWKKYLEKNLDANVPVTKDKAPYGDYTVKLEFIVTETGEINNISATKVPEHCPSCAIESVRMIKLGPKWDPMTIDGKEVTSKLVQFISFRVQKDQ